MKLCQNCRYPVVSGTRHITIIGATEECHVVPLIEADVPLLEADLSSRKFSQFFGRVNDALSSKAKDKGYATGPDDPNPTFEMTGMEHAIGEIIYKALRYRERARRGEANPEELEKIAAWAFLIWRHRS